MHKLYIRECIIYIKVYRMVKRGKISLSIVSFVILTFFFIGFASAETNISGNYSDNGEEYEIGSLGDREVNITLVCNSSCNATVYCIDDDNDCS